MAPHKWRDIHKEELLRSPELWEQCGVAVEAATGAVIGAVVLTGVSPEQPEPLRGLQSLLNLSHFLLPVYAVENEPDAALSYWEVNRRAGCLPTLLTMCYDSVLEEPLQDHECLVDFLAVSAKARGRGVGRQLMRWAEAAATRILTSRMPLAVAQRGVTMVLWVAADNTPAVRLYEIERYGTVRRTDEAACACLSSHVFRRFLGHPVWWKMQKALELSPEQAAAVKRKKTEARPPAVEVVARPGGIPTH